MRKLLIGCIALILLGGSVPAPRGHVNDFADIIPQDREAALEQRLRGYEAQTSIELTIVTVSSLEDEPIEDFANETFRKWGIGKEDANNGVLIVVAPNEREWRIEVGYGLEGDLTDARSHALGNELLPDAFRAGDYAGGLENLSGSIMQVLGGLTPEERAQRKQEREHRATVQAAKRREEAKNFLWDVTAVASFLAAIALIVLLFRFVRRKYLRWQSDRRERQRIQTKLRESEAAVNGLKASFFSLAPPALPPWMRERYEERRAEAGSKFQEEAILRDQIRLFLKKALSVAKVRYDSYENLLGTIRDDLDFLSGISGLIETYRQETAEETQAAIDQTKALISQAESLAKEGYRLDVYMPNLKAKEREAEAAALAIALKDRGEGESDKSREVREAAEKLARQAKALSAELSNLVSLQQETDRTILDVGNRLKKFPQTFREYQAYLEHLKTFIPGVLLAGHLASAGRTAEAIPRIRLLADSAKQKNGMEVQQFSTASAEISQAERLLDEAERDIGAARALERRIGEAKRSYPDLAVTTENRIRQASDSSKHPDARGKSARDLNEAQGKLGEAKVLASQKLVDWILVTGLLLEARKKADQAYAAAESAISTAETARRKKQREEEASSAYSPASSTRSNQDDPFRGFGGGSSGGGGASGRW